MTWHTGPLALFDLETTGIDPHRDRIVSAALILVQPGQEKASRTWLLDPGIDIPEAAAAVHGITTEQARAEGRPAAQGVDEIAGAVLEATTAGIPIVGHNVTYDLTMLACEAYRHHGDAGDAILTVAPVVDTFVLDKQVDRYRRGSRKLVDVAAHYGITLTEQDAHGAEADALAAGRIAWVMAKAYPAKLNLPLEDLHRAQVEWKRQQADSFGAYLVKSGKTDDVSREWPVQSPPEGWDPSGTSPSAAPASVT